MPHICKVNLLFQEREPLAKPPPSLDDLCKTHPVVGVLHSRTEPEAYDFQAMTEFVDYEFRNGPHGLPYTLTNFFADYLNFSIVRFLRNNRSRYGYGHFSWDTKATTDKMAKLAYVSKMRDAKLSEGTVKKILSPTGFLQRLSSFRESKSPRKIPSGENGSLYESDLELKSMGLLERVEDSNEKPYYQFRELCLRDYLMALFQASECKRKVEAGRDAYHVVSSAMRESMKQLPETSDIWRITFGLLSKDSQTQSCLKDVLRELIEEAKPLPDMTPFDITNLCVEAIYESQNGGEMASLLDDFTLNQTIRYSNQVLEQNRLLYAVSAVGYLVRSSQEVYGVHMSQFGLGANIKMLADPVNDVSDNNLQVLNLSYNPLQSAGVKGLLRFLIKATLLTHLDLTACQIGNLGISLISEFFMCMPLRYLRLTENGIGDAGILRMVPNLKFVVTLEWLDLSENEMTDDSAVTFGDGIQVLRNLRSLDLRHNNIGDLGVTAITKSLALMDQVTHLMLADNKIGERGASKMSDHVWKTKSLRYINLSLNQIPAAGIMGLRKAATSHGSLRISVTERNRANLSDTSLMNLTSNSEAEFIIGGPDDDTNSRRSRSVSRSSPGPLTRPRSMIVSPGPYDQQQTNMGSAPSVDLLVGRSKDFERGNPIKRSWSARSTLRRSFHGLGSSFRRKLVEAV